MDENTLHKECFVKEANKVRAKTGMPKSCENQIENWLQSNIKIFLKVVYNSFKKVRKKMGLSEYYLNYFISCVLSDHEGSTYPHSLPKSFKFLISKKDIYGNEKISRKGYYKLNYYPIRSIPDKYSWIPVSPPRAFFSCGLICN